MDGTERFAVCVCDDVTVRLLALVLTERGEEAYHVSFCSEPRGEFRPGLMAHAGGVSWDITEGPSVSCAKLSLGSPDEVFRIALGQSELARRAREATVSEAALPWPRALTERLARRCLSGAGTVAFDAGWFLAELATSAFDRPLVFPDAASKLGLVGLERASALVKGIAAAGVGQGQVPEAVLARVLLGALSAQFTADGALEWDGEGRLLGEYGSDEHGQLGSDIGAGCRAVLGSGLLQVVFEPAELLGLGFGPLHPAETRLPGDPDSVGMGAEVGEVDAQGAAERSGVTTGMVLARLSNPDLMLSSGGRSTMPFEAVMHELDLRRATGDALTVSFDTAAAVTHLYAVEMPAAAVLAALAAAFGGATDYRCCDAAVGAALPGPELLWREETPRLFLGEAGSLTCAHTDICPQLEVAHGLLGVKLLGVASHAATPRLSVDHGENRDEEATHVPTDRPLTPRQTRLLSDPDVTLALLQEGDLAVFASGALHFASNGGGGLNAALYHGMITPAAVPRLRLAAAEAAGSHSSSDGAYGNHLFAADLLAVVEPLLASFNESRRAGSFSDL